MINFITDFIGIFLVIGFVFLYMAFCKAYEYFMTKEPADKIIKSVRNDLGWFTIHTGYYSDKEDDDDEPDTWDVEFTLVDSMNPKRVTYFERFPGVLRDTLIVSGDLEWMNSVERDALYYTVKSKISAHKAKVKKDESAKEKILMASRREEAKDIYNSY